MPVRKQQKVAIVGAGRVGTALAYALLIKGPAREITLANRTPERAHAEALDLSHGLSYVSPTRVAGGGYEMCDNADVVVLTAGAAQKEGETRLDLVRKNAEITKKIIPEVLSRTPSPILIVVTNPVDVLTYVALKESGLPASRVIGSGTVLDTARFSYSLSRHFDVDTRNVHAYIVGEHGDSEVPLWSRANIAGVPVDEYGRLRGMDVGPEFRRKMADEVRTAAYHIIERKEATYWGIGLAVTRIIEAILKNQHSVLTVSALVRDYYGISDVCLSLPSVVGQNGIEAEVTAKLADEEVERLRDSASVIQDSLRSIGYLGQEYRRAAASG
ncbi:L-lactate dehydrogenase [Desulfocurvibacter africanus PCS]|uniref:L-lactate dehydrogenase n=1 Tax=Desulfocurvibacter africanus PCS TaxID=1262666 RepID=M5Q2A2_DESAF|nr:L-lactate dehydrogenase [Desulfocurvibacter africanus]EMG37248.1 L-lactate dehydrogenase [Desulfocurvibacter africanus PCS]